MDLQKLSIGQMAELNHVSEQTLRLYDKEGLLVPRCVDPVTGLPLLSHHPVCKARPHPEHEGLRNDAAADTQLS